MDEMAEQEIIKNKAIRGYIIRALAKGNQNTLLVRQVTNALVADGLIYSPDISKHIEYLEEAGMDVTGLSTEDLLDVAEVFPVGDGTYLIVEA